MIYFCRWSDGSVKIGMTIRFPARMKDHGKTGEVIILGVRDGGADVERAIHRQFDHLRVNGNGHGRRLERFRAEPELLRYIAENCREPDLFDQLHETRPKEKVVRLELPLAEHRRFRYIAACHDTNMAFMARKIILEWISQYQSKES